MLLSRRLLFVPLLFSGLAISQKPPTPGELPKTDFSGRWRMAKDKSDFHGFAMPGIVIRKVDQHGPTLNVHTIQTSGEKTTTNDATYFTDGSITNNVINGRDAQSKCYWDGSVLVVRTSMKTAKGLDELVTDRWELSEDKQELTIASRVQTEKGGIDMKMVSVREEPNH